jgi:hypothetical protein
VLRGGDAAVRRIVSGLRTRLRGLQSPSATAITPAVPLAVAADRPVLVPQPAPADPEVATPEPPQPESAAGGPGPGPGLTTSALDLPCPAKALPSGTPVAVSGRLTPPQRAAPIELTYTHSSGLSVSHQAQTDEQGNFGDEFKPLADGAWTVGATFAGDAHHSAATAACTLTIGG